MLRVEHVPARIQRGALVLKDPSDHQLEVARRMAREYLAILDGSEGRTRLEIEEELGAVEVPPRGRLVALGLRKLLEDRCTWETAAEDPAALRAEVFEAAAVARMAGPFDRAAVLAAVAAARGTTPEALDEALFADLKEQQRLVSLEPVGAKALVEAWRLGLPQAVLLRATRVVVELSGTAAGWRRLFAKMKFLRLLFRAERTARGVRLLIDGPYSLFASTTKYGVQLAMLLPALRDAGPFKLQADVLWGPARAKARFTLEGGAEADGSEAPLPDELAALVAAWPKLGTDWTLRRSDALVDLPGVGAVLPDLEFRRGKQVVQLELLGYWSREAVWKRVELVERGLKTPIVFAVSERLRVSEEALPDDAPAALIVFKGVLRAKAVLERVEAVAAVRSRPTGAGARGG